MKFRFLILKMRITLKIINKNVFHERLYFDKELKTFLSDYDKEVLNIHPNTLIEGLFQSEKYLFGYDLNEFIKFDNNYIDSKI